MRRAFRAGASRRGRWICRFGNITVAPHLSREKFLTPTSHHVTWFEWHRFVASLHRSQSCITYAFRIAGQLTRRNPSTRVADNPAGTVEFPWGRRRENRASSPARLRETGTVHARGPRDRVTIAPKTMPVYLETWSDVIPSPGRRWCQRER